MTNITRDLEAKSGHTNLHNAIEENLDDMLWSNLQWRLYSYLYNNIIQIVDASE